MKETKLVGSLFTRILALSLPIGWLIFTMYMFFKNPSLIYEPFQIFGFSIIAIFLAFMAGMMSYYFILSSEVLIIKNHILFWVRKEIIIEKIHSVEYSYRPKIGYGLSIKLKKSSPSFYGANGLSEKEFTVIYHALKNKNIIIKGFQSIDAELINN